MAASVNIVALDSIPAGVQLESCWVVLVISRTLGSKDKRKASSVCACTSPNLPPHPRGIVVHLWWISTKPFVEFCDTIIRSVERWCARSSLMSNSSVYVSRTKRNVSESEWDRPKGTWLCYWTHIFDWLESHQRVLDAGCDTPHRKSRSFLLVSKSWQLLGEARRPVSPSGCLASIWYGRSRTCCPGKVVHQAHCIVWTLRWQAWSHLDTCDIYQHRKNLHW